MKGCLVLKMQSLQRHIMTVEGGIQAEKAISNISIVGAILKPLNHRLFWRYCNQLSKKMPRRQYACVIDIATDTKMRIFLDDPYWARLISRSFTYEADFEKVLKRFEGIGYTFLDCGANFGYWSLLVSGNALGAHTTLAIEASPTTFGILSENCSLNQKRFSVLNRAISHDSGLSVYITDKLHHAGTHIDFNKTNGHHIKTITIDDALQEQFGTVPTPLLIKLDVEGQEINAFGGAEKAIAQGALFYYEDHGKDIHCEVTRYVLDKLKLSVFFATDQGKVIPIESVEDALSVKHQRTIGYNFFACLPDSVFYPVLEQAIRE